MPGLLLIGVALCVALDQRVAKIVQEHCAAAFEASRILRQLIANRTQATGLELFTNLGIDPRKKKIVVVKSTNHFMAAYGPIAKKVIYVESSGPLRRDPTKMPFTKVDRPIWPLDRDAKPRGLIF